MDFGNLREREVWKFESERGQKATVIPIGERNCKVADNIAFLQCLARGSIKLVVWVMADLGFAPIQLHTTIYLLFSTFCVCLILSPSKTIIYMPFCQSPE